MHIYFYQNKIMYPFSRLYSSIFRCYSVSVLFFWRTACRGKCAKSVQLCTRRSPFWKVCPRKFAAKNSLFPRCWNWASRKTTWSASTGNSWSDAGGYRPRRCSKWLCCISHLLKMEWQAWFELFDENNEIFGFLSQVENPKTKFLIEVFFPRKNCCVVFNAVDILRVSFYSLKKNNV